MKETIRFFSPNWGKSSQDPDYDDEFDEEKEYEDYLDAMYEDRC